MPVGGKRIFSGEPLPIQPLIKEPELDAFHRKILDYLRRLTAKLDRFVAPPTGTGNVTVFSAYKDADQTFYEGAESKILWEVELRKDSPFTFEAGSSDIEVTEDGFYILEVDIRSIKNLPYTVYVRVTDTLPVYALSHFTPSVDDTFSIMVPLVLVAGDVITVSILLEAGGDAFIYADGTRLLITHIGEEATE